jgi:hypothetical protein
MMRRWIFGLFWFALTVSSWGQLRVDHSTVTVEKRGDRDWCLLDVGVSGIVEAPVGALATVIQDYSSYSKLFPRLHEVRWEEHDGSVFLSETVVVSVLGVENVNQFTLRMNATTTPTGFNLPWTQEKTDGSIDSMEGGWVLEDRGVPGKPQTWVSYRTKSAVLTTAFGQDLLLRMFLGGETKAIVEAVVKAALHRSTD